MVQMKGCTGKTTLLCEASLYIPHGSDERKVEERLYVGFKFALYPTWFR